MRKLLIYVDASVVGGCEDPEFSSDSLTLWKCFIEGRFTMALSELTLRELKRAPDSVRDRTSQVPVEHQVILDDSDEADELADAYLGRNIVGPGSRADALHVALATVGRVDVLVSWNFKHIVNLGKIRQFNAVNIERGYGMLEIKTPREVLERE